MALVILAYVGLAAFFLGLVARTLVARRRSEEGSATMAVLKQLVADHLALARDRLGAAEARIALLEERVGFYEGFARPPAPWRPVAPAPTTAPADDAAHEPATVLPFRAPSPSTEQRP